MEDKQSLAAELHSEDDLSFVDEPDEFVPHFQRVSISGEDISGVPLEDLECASRLIIQALELRERHMSISHQSFPQTTARFLKSVHDKTMSDKVEYEDKRTTAGKLSTFFIYTPPRKTENKKRKFIYLYYFFHDKIHFNSSC